MRICSVVLLRFKYKLFVPAEACRLTTGSWYESKMVHVHICVCEDMQQWTVRFPVCFTLRTERTMQCGVMLLGP